MVDIATGTVEDLRAARATEYGTFVAAEEIRIDGVLAFGIGWQVPVSHTEEYPQLLKTNEETGLVPVVTVEEYAAMQAEKEQEKEAEEVPEPSADGGRSAWVKFARSKGAPDEELATIANGGLARDDLAAKYGTEAPAA